MLMSLRSTVSDANGQGSKHRTNCASSRKTCPSHRLPTLSPGLVPAGDCRDGFDLVCLLIAGRVPGERGTLDIDFYVVYWGKT